MNINLILITFSSLLFTMVCKMYFDILHLQTNLEQSNLKIIHLTNTINEITVKNNLAVQEILMAQSVQINNMHNTIISNTEAFASQNAILCTLTIVTLGLITFCILFFPTNDSISAIVNNSVTKIGSELSVNELTTIGNALKEIVERNEEINCNLSTLIIATKYAILEEKNLSERFIDSANVAALNSATINSAVETTTNLLS